MYRSCVPKSISAEVESKDDIIMVDFDYTLFASNSTEMFISHCRPSFIVALIDFFIRELIPWKLTRLAHCHRLRDYVCCTMIVIFTPWNFLLWRRNAPSLFKNFESQLVSSSFAEADLQRTIIVSFGIRWIIAALVANSRWRDVQLIATPNIAKPQFFTLGKLSVAKNFLSNDIIERAAFVTDSLDDEDMLRATRSGLLIEPQGRFYKASYNLYLPMRYTINAKYPRLYTIDQLLFVDILIAITASSHNIYSLFRACLVVPWLVISMMCVYELGYYENDTKAALKERNPSITLQVVNYQNYPIKAGAWTWAITFGFIGTWIGCYFEFLRIDHLSAVLLWVIVLVILRVVFSFYNGLPLKSRVLAYPLLQTTKYCSPFALIQPTIAGAILVFSQIAQMWFRYFIYRNGGNNNIYNPEIIRLIFFIICSACATMCLSHLPGYIFSYFISGFLVCARLLKAPILKRVSKFKLLAIYSKNRRN